jgi:uncharacterized protein
LNPKYKDELIAIIKKHLPECRIYLFGSQARETSTQGSDIDLAIDCGATAPQRLMSQIREDIEESNIPYFVDVVDFCEASDTFKEQIIKDMVVWKD